LIAAWPTLPDRVFAQFSDVFDLLEDSLDQPSLEAPVAKDRIARILAAISRGRVDNWREWLRVLHSMWQQPPQHAAPQPLPQASTPAPTAEASGAALSSGDRAAQVDTLPPAATAPAQPATADHTASSAGQ
jgi:hypothetical protein